MSIEPPEPPVGEPSLADEVRGLVAAARERAESEIAFQKARAGVAGRRTGIAAGLGCVAVGFAFLAVFALIVGAILALTPLVGAWAAMGIVVLALMALAAIAALVAFGQVRRLLALWRSEP